MKYLAAIMAVFCWGAVLWMTVGTLSHSWYSADLMVASLLAPLPVAIMGCFWTWRSVVTL